MDGMIYGMGILKLLSLDRKRFFVESEHVVFAGQMCTL
jgi:hypothetical protein